MSFKYPRMGRCVKYIRKSEDVVEVTDYMTKNSFECSIEETSFIRRLDGRTDPFSIPTALSDESIGFILEELENRGFFEQSRIRKVGGELLVGLWYPKNTKGFKKFARCWNTLLMILWIPTAAVGGIMGYNLTMRSVLEVSVWGSLFSVVVNIVLHELSHAFAAAAYGARAFELGVGVTKYIFLCGYTMTDSELIRNRMKRIQCLFAGVESGLLLAGTLAILGCLLPSARNFLMSAAASSAIMSVTNIVFVSGLDGNAVMAELLGVELANALPFSILMSKECRSAISHIGPTGKAILMIFILFALTYLIIPLYLILVILEVIFI